MKRVVVPSIALAAIALPACLQIENFFFAGEPIDAYRWDEVSPDLDGDLSEPHASIIPAIDREEGFAELADGTRVHWVFAHREGATATILYAHGNGPHLGRFWDRVERLWELGYHVVIYDYPGFGRSEGTSSEQGMYDAATAMWGLVPTLRDVDPDRVLLYGYSLGAGPTFHLAAQTARAARRPRAVIAESAWCSIEAQIQDGAFLDLPQELLAHLEIDNCARIAELPRDVPVLILHGTRDAICSERQAPLLEGASSAPVTLRWVEGARHAELPSVAGERYHEWIESHATAALER